MKLSAFPCLIVVALLGAAVVPLVHGQTIYINDTFESYAVGAVPTSLAASLVTVTAGTGVIGPDQVANLNDNNASSAGGLEFNAGDAALGSLYLQFDLLNVNPGSTGTAANPAIFGVGAWGQGTSLALNSNASRAFGLEFYGQGSSSTLKLRVGSTAVVTSTYDMAAVQSVQVWVNDNDANTLSFTRPDTATSGLLAPNSFIVFINGAQFGSAQTGYAMNGVEGDATIGRFGFYTGKTQVSMNFLIDNVYAASPIPEPSTYAAFLGLGALGAAAWLRRRRVRA